MLESGNPAIFASGVSVDPSPGDPVVCVQSARSGQSLDTATCAAGFREEKAESQRVLGTRQRSHKC